MLRWYRGTIKSLRMMQSASFGGLEYALSREADAQGQTVSELKSFKSKSRGLWLS